MKPLHIVRFVAAGAIGGAVIMKVALNGRRRLRPHRSRHRYQRRRRPRRPRLPAEPADARAAAAPPKSVAVGAAAARARSAEAASANGTPRRSNGRSVRRVAAPANQPVAAAAAGGGASRDPVLTEPPAPTSSTRAHRAGARDSAARPPLLPSPTRLR